MKSQNNIEQDENTEEDAQGMAKPFHRTEERGLNKATKFPAFTSGYAASRNYRLD
ncbi:hypothetical protein GCM10023187_43070 [Nibrella viscosa]|uniref:Uncharacterized protein n=1 Tax=Nibrella viscosa TaxID=1084524 RepID=A0ABP8KR96_9BACT